MPMSERDISILRHIISYCEDIERAVNRFGHSYEAFHADKDYRNCCAMCILQIGELGGHLSSEFRTAHGEIPWDNIRGMRNVMAHAYGTISVQTTWETIEQDIPVLKAFCTSILEKSCDC